MLGTFVPMRIGVTILLTTVVMVTEMVTEIAIVVIMATV
jgi:hypothetical protein